MKPDEELRHLLHGAKSEDVLNEVGIIIIRATCIDTASLVLEKCQEVMRLILNYQTEKWPSEEEWYKLLPEWFINICSPEKNPKEEEEYLEKWRQSSPQEQILLEESAWSVMEWVSWFEPTDDLHNQRYWFWWDAIIKDPNTLLIAVAVVDIPIPYGSLFWLLTASGAISVEEANEID
jgi:hypothetical protein